MYKVGWKRKYFHNKLNSKNQSTEYFKFQRWCFSLWRLCYDSLVQSSIMSVYVIESPFLVCKCIANSWSTQYTQYNTIEFIRIYRYTLSVHGSEYTHTFTRVCATHLDAYTQTTRSVVKSKSTKFFSTDEYLANSFQQTVQMYIFGVSCRFYFSKDSLNLYW